MKTDRESLVIWPNNWPVVMQFQRRFTSINASFATKSIFFTSTIHLHSHKSNKSESKKNPDPKKSGPEKRGWARAFAASPDYSTPLDALGGLGGSPGSEAWDKDVDTQIKIKINMLKKININILTQIKIKMLTQIKIKMNMSSRSQLITLYT